MRQAGTHIEHAVAVISPDDGSDRVLVEGISGCDGDDAAAIAVALRVLGDIAAVPKERLIARVLSRTTVTDLEEADRT